VPSKFVKPDEVLSAILGSSEPVLRNQITQLVLAYVESKGLLKEGPPIVPAVDENSEEAKNNFCLRLILKLAKGRDLGNYTMVVADEKLQRLFEGKKMIRIDHMTGYIELHMESVPDAD
jgi:chromatin remodeling complex protein RSC6